MMMNWNSHCFAPFVYTMSAASLTLIRDVGVPVAVSLRATDFPASIDRTNLIGLSFQRVFPVNVGKVNRGHQFGPKDSRAP